MKIIFLFFLALISNITYAQKNEKHKFDTYQAIDYMLLFNPNSDKESYYDGNTGQMEEPSKFVIAGLAGHYEYGITYKEWVRIGIQTGIYANIYDAAYTIPIATALTLAPKISDEILVYGKFALGWNTAIGKGNKNGMFTHYHFGAEFGGGSRLFFFVNDHGFHLKNRIYQSAGIGFGGTLFKSKK